MDFPLSDCQRPSPRVLLAGLLAAPAIAMAAPAAAAPTEVEFECAQLHLPSQQAVSALLDIPNFSQAYLARVHLMERVKHACNREGTVRVRVLAPQSDGRRITGVN